MVVHRGIRPYVRWLGDRVQGQVVSWIGRPCVRRLGDRIEVQSRNRCRWINIRWLGDAFEGTVLCRLQRAFCRWLGDRVEGQGGGRSRWANSRWIGDSNRKPAVLALVHRIGWRRYRRKRCALRRQIASRKRWAFCWRIGDLLFGKVCDRIRRSGFIGLLCPQLRFLPNRRRWGAGQWFGERSA